MSEVYDSNLFLIRFAQTHESFRLPELKALGEIHGIDYRVVDYKHDSPFCVIHISPDPTISPSSLATTLISRSVLIHTISQLWCTAPSWQLLHPLLQSQTSHLWSTYQSSSFRFTLDSYASRRSQASKLSLIESFSYLSFRGPIITSGKSVDETWLLSEEFPLPSSHCVPPPDLSPSTLDLPRVKRVFFSRLISADSSRHVAAIQDLKLRNYVSTTSMDAELSLLTANMSLVAPGKVVYDPFCGTGSFLVAAAHFGGIVAGSDMDGRVVRGKCKDSKVLPSRKGKVEDRARRGDGVAKGNEAGRGERSAKGNLKQYGLEGMWLDGFVADLTNSPMRILPFNDGNESGRSKPKRWLDCIVCDPPYGIREGLKVLGTDKPELLKEVRLPDGQLAHLADNYIPPRRAYSFEAMLADILTFAADTLVENGRVCIWIPGENKLDEQPKSKSHTKQESCDDEVKIDMGIPSHPCLQLISVSTQSFVKWSRRLAVYSRIADTKVDTKALTDYNLARLQDLRIGGTADELNDFRRKFFEGFSEKMAS